MKQTLRERLIWLIDNLHREHKLIRVNMKKYADSEDYVNAGLYQARAKEVSQMLDKLTGILD